MAKKTKKESAVPVRVKLHSNGSLLVECDGYSRYNINDIIKKLQDLRDLAPEEHRDNVFLFQNSWTEYYEDNWCYSTEVYYEK